MPIQKGTMGYQRYRISMAEMSPEKILEKLRLFKFRPLHGQGFDNEARGWCAFLSEYDHERELELKDIIYDKKIILSLRCDSIVLPKPLLKSMIKKSIASYYQEHKKWPERVVKKEIEQAEAQSLRARVLPKTRVVDALWCQSSQEIRLFNRSSSLTDSFLDLFSSTFLTKPSRRDFAHEAFWFAQSVNQSQAIERITHKPLFAPCVRVDIQ